MNRTEKMVNFLKAYVKSMRLYYAFVTGIAGWLGVAFYDHIATDYHTVEIFPPFEKKCLILVILFLSWGINQIINDYLGLKEDRINAPDRPMVTGELNAQHALFLSSALILGTALVTWFYLEPIALIPFFLGIILNIIYEQVKSYGILGNITFGLMITMCSAFGFLAAGPTQAPYFTSSRISVLLVLLIMNGLMTFYTYFKDYEGDKAAGKNTIVVHYGLGKSRILAITFSFFPTLIFVFIYLSGFIDALITNAFIILGLLTLYLQVWTGILYYKNPKGKLTYRSLVVNFRACTCGQATLIALFNKELATMLFLVSYIVIGFLFNLHQNHKA
jgi:geranylgeranylglycerol-phosphate geranylgeranyltransferase